MDNLLISLAQQLGQILQQNQLHIVTAESCTGGGLAEAMTAIPGSSGWFDRGFISYSNQSKIAMLGVTENLIQRHGAVSLEVADAMAIGAIQHSQAQISVAITGIAGPDGGSIEKPVGMVCFGFAYLKQGQIKVETTQQLFVGDREAIRAAAIVFGLKSLLSFF